jgi:hypothetical protein
MGIDKNRYLMKYLHILILFLFSSIVFAEDSESLVLSFSNKVKSAVASSDVETFKNLECHPKNCTNDGYTIKEIFSDAENDTNFEKILKENDVQIKVVGPYTYNSDWPKSSYTVIFFSSSNSPFDSNGEISDEVGVRELYKTFLQMIVTIRDGVVGFHRVPFHLESHHPYVGDYG